MSLGFILICDVGKGNVDAMLSNKSITLGLHTTTLEGIHVNSMHLTTREKCYVIRGY